MVKMLNGLVIPKQADEANYQLDVKQRQDLLNFASHYYDVPGRHYHNFEHVTKMIERHTQYFGCDPTDALFFAIVMHDAIWIAGQSPRSEEMSMALVPYVYHQVVGETIPLWFNDIVFQLIRWTIAVVHVRDNRPPSCNSLLINPDAERILDLDLSSMSLDWEDFIKIQQSIDLEFLHTANSSQRMIASAGFLKQFIVKGFVYYSKQMEHLNTKALRNLKAYVACIEKTNIHSWDALLRVNPTEMEGLYHT